MIKSLNAVIALSTMRSPRRSYDITSVANVHFLNKSLYIIMRSRFPVIISFFIYFIYTNFLSKMPGSDVPAKKRNKLEAR